MGWTENMRKGKQASGEEETVAEAGGRVTLCSADLIHQDNHLDDELILSEVISVLEDDLYVYRNGKGRWGGVGWGGGGGG